MASKASAMKGAKEIPVFSRFAVLEEDSCNSSDEDKTKEVLKNTEIKKMSKSAKKRAKKKKKSASDAAESEELRNMAFRAKPLIKGSHPVASLSTSNTHVVTKEERPELMNEGDPMSWESWKTRDEQFVMEQFQHDLERALDQSLRDAKQRQKIEEMILLDQSSKGSPKKDHGQKMSLLEFQTLPSENDTHHETNTMPWPDEENDEILQNGVHNNVCNLQEDDSTQPNKKDKKKKKKKKAIIEPSSNGFVKDKIQSESIPKENGRTDDQISANLDPASIAQWMYEVEKKDKIIEKMNTEMELMKAELSQVKKRNKQLCFILGQGEMKDKSDLLQQIEELTAVKDELSTELSEMHSALEQERSKVSSYKQELAKQQSSRLKRQSITDP